MRSFDRFGRVCKEGLAMKTFGKFILGAIGGTLALGTTAAPAQAQWNRYDHYRGGSNRAVNACVYEAQRYSRGGRVRVFDVDRKSRDRFRIKGVVSSRYGGYGRNRHGDRRFTCVARGYGRITHFSFNRGRW
jgi:hypothetical protein